MVVLHLKSLENNLFDLDFSISKKLCFYGQTFSGRWIFCTVMKYSFSISLLLSIYQNTFESIRLCFRKRNPIWVNNLNGIICIEFADLQNRYLSWKRLPIYLRASKSSLTGLSLSASCWGGCLTWVYRHLFWCIHPPTARYTWFYKRLPASQY